LAAAAFLRAAGGAPAEKVWQILKDKGVAE
jgi:hypothetical protein